MLQLIIINHQKYLLYFILNLYDNHKLAYFWMDVFTDLFFEYPKDLKQL